MFTYLDDISDECLGENGDPCIFPFNYQGQTFDECTTFDANAGKAWCAVAVNENGDMSSWKNCIMASCLGVKTNFLCKYISDFGFSLIIGNP